MCLLTWAWDGFEGWRGYRHILVREARDPFQSVDSVDLRIGERTR